MPKSKASHNDFKCRICKKLFTEKAGLKLHIKLHSDERPYACSQCDYTCKTNKYLSRHAKQVHCKTLAFKCDVCDKAFSTKSGLDRHTLVHTDAKPYKCDVCGKGFNSYYSFTTHKYIHLDIKPYKCQYCEYACRDNSTLRKHQERHLGIRKYFQCTQCERRYEKKCDLRVHVTEVHMAVDVKTKPCEVCGKMFKSNTARNSHVKLVHERRYREKCDICGFVVANRYNMRAHLSSHLDQRNFECTFEDCNKKYKDKQGLYKHSLIHCPERQHACDVCGKLFTRRARLAAHKKTHYTDRLYICDYCSTAFYNKSHLRLHIIGRHAPRATYTCELCGLRTRNKPSIVMHLKYWHAAERDRKCKICNKMFKKHMYLKLHYWRTHSVKYKTMQRKKKVKRPCIVKLVADPEDYKGIELLHEIKVENLSDIEQDADDTEYSNKVFTEDLQRATTEADDAKAANDFNFDDFLVRYVEKPPDFDEEAFRKQINNRKTSCDTNYNVQVKRFALNTSARDTTDIVQTEGDKKRGGNRKGYKLKIKLKRPNENNSNDEFDAIGDEPEVNSDGNDDITANDDYNDEGKSDGSRTQNRRLIGKRNGNKLRARHDNANKTYKNEECDTMGDEPQENGDGNDETAKGGYIDDGINDETANGDHIDDGINDESKTHNNRKCTVKQNADETNKNDECNAIGDEQKQNSNENDITANGDENDDRTANGDQNDDEKNGESKTQNNRRRTANRNGNKLKTKLNNTNELKNEECNTAGDEPKVNSDGNDDITANGDHTDDGKSVESKTHNRRRTGNRNGDKLKIKIVIPKETNENDECIKKCDESKVNGGGKDDTTANDDEKSDSSDEYQEDDDEVNDKTYEIGSQVKKTRKCLKVTTKVATVKKSKRLVKRNVKTRRRGPSSDDSKECDENCDKSDVSGDENDEDDGTNDGVSKSNKFQINTHQCYVCFKLYETKDKLIDHCKEHFDVCNVSMLTKCPLCDYVTSKEIAKHMRTEHDLNIDIPRKVYQNIKDRKNNNNKSRFYFDIKNNEVDEIEVIPSIKNLNRQERLKMERKNREIKDKAIVKTKLVKKRGEWIVQKEAFDTKKDYHIPKIEEIENFDSEIADYLVKIKKFSRIAKKEGRKIMFPCQKCEKICQTFSALKLHWRRHDPDKKPFKKKIWKHKLTEDERRKLDENEKLNVKKKNEASESRYDKPKPIVNKHKCDPKLKAFYENNIKGGDIEFWQFLKIFNKMSRENINDFSDLQNRPEFGIHIPNENVKSADENNTEEIAAKEIVNSKVTVANNLNKFNNVKKMPKVSFKRTIMLSRKSYERRNAEIERLRQKNANKSA